MRSDKIKKGPETAPQRSLLYALGLTDQRIRKASHWYRQFQK